MYLVLNCLTLGIYGFIVANQMQKEINSLCKGDKQAPGTNYVAAMLFSKFVPVLGGYYYNYMWYQQANRLKLNANRYGLQVKESGTDIFLMRTILELPLVALTLIAFIASLLVPVVLGLLLFALVPALGVVVMAVAVLALVIFSNELTAGAMLANCYMIKNLNRFADVYRNGAAEFDPMAYEYYPAISNRYPAAVSHLVTVAPAMPVVTPPELVDPVDEGNTRTLPMGVLVGEKGTCAGYKFDLAPGEEIIIGKDAKVSHVVVDPAHKEVSRKHVGVVYDISADQYVVTDYSSNGTWVNETKMESGSTVYARRGSDLRLAGGKNVFRLG